MAQENAKTIAGHCGACGATFAPEHLVRLASAEGQETFHATCGKCGASALVAFAHAPFGGVVLGAMTDLTSEEIHRFFGEPGISTDTILDAYEILQKNPRALEENL